MPKISTRLIIAVILAGVIGTVVNALGAAVYIDSSKLSFALVPGRYLVAIGCVATLPFIEHWFRGLTAKVTGLAVLIILPSLLAKFVFGAGAPWTTVLLLNSVFAVAAFITYRVVKRK